MVEAGSSPTGCDGFVKLMSGGGLLPPLFLFIMYPHFFDGAKKRRYPSKKRFPTPAVCSRKRCPLHKGTKTLHRKNGDSDSRPPSFRPTAVFILHLSPGDFWLDLDGWDCNPSVCFADTSLCTREAALRVTCNPSSVFAASGESTFPSGKAMSSGNPFLRRDQGPALRYQLSVLH